ncbi:MULTISPECIES: RHS repeat-associated core domain-containing protein [Streptomyces]|uniref:RHS repeat-associated protein n=1 Tax=Streptomyces clavifer TaxID=68188 RepID=A0ABS4VHL3_9ACTN|nr:MULTISPECIES: RHS repeat-associated core domain-containing protein [Streptomyces]MBP2363417.1 RHS repeat-associated protein [Streptomyces clavifer]MDX2748035.1 polymorphic toxin-type HINT domain-containing protein [Streptomyces sp. NRRL_B-2557]
MVGTLLQAVTQPVAADDNGTQALPATFEKPVAGTTAKVKPRTVMKSARTPAVPPDSKWPAASTTVVDLPGTETTTTKFTRAPSLPLTLDTRLSSKAKPARGSVETSVLSRTATKKAGIDGVLFTLRGKDTTTKAQPGQVRSSLDYSSFAGAYGGGYASRLTLVELPACAVITPDKEACRTTKRIKTVNDVEKQTLTAPAVTLRANAPTVLAAVAESESANGDYQASALAASATWNTNLNTGDFNWSYNMPVPDVPGGMLPNVGLSYSSGSVDGRTGNTNNQASWAGDGFETWPGFIERRYKSCADDGQKSDDGLNKPGDLCWAYDNAYLSLNGKAGELVPDGTDTWKLKSDDGTKIERTYETSRNNGARKDESWRVTTPDGTRYHFGYHRLPGWTEGKETTDSTWTVPVYGDDSGEPCHADTFADSWCQQGWRWNLDYVVDTHSNAITYFYDKEDNYYGRNLKAEDGTPYVRGGTLDRIQYGLKSSSPYTTKPLAKVTFTNTERCLSDSHTTCADINTDAAYWYDTPWDLDCDSGEDCDQGRLSPSFFTTKRLTKVTTQIWDGSTYQDVDSWKLAHRWGMADTDYQLLLDSVQHTGHSATPAITLPRSSFAYTQLANRLDKTGDGYAPFVKDRLSTISDESGGQIDVNYSAPACSFDTTPTPQTNTTRCFPQYIGGSDSDDPERQWFNKYVVASVTATDRTGKAPDQVTSYNYLGGAAWHYDDDDGLTKEKFKTWSQWRGYGHVRVQTGGQGGAAAMKTQQDTYFLRGMDGDRKDTSGGKKDVTVTLGTGEGDPITDHESAASFPYKTATYSAPGGKILSKSVSRPWHHQTAKKERDWGTVTANFTGTATSRTFTSLDDGAGSKWRTTSSATTYETTAGRITRTDDHGDDSLPDDSTCTRTTYATNTTQNILGLPSRVESVSTACDTTPSRPSDVISDVRSAYDSAPYGAEPTKGDATATALLTKYDGTTAVYVESGATHDDYGRTLTSTDLTADVTVTAAGTLTRTPRSDGRITTTVRTPATNFPTTVKTTTPPATTADAASAQTSTTTHENLRGLPLTQTDTNGKVTNFAYDALGRSTKVWLPDRLTDKTPTYEFTYTTTENKPISVGTKTIAENGTQAASYVLYDGFLRPRQAQAPGPDGGALLTDTFYDERGLVTKEFATYYIDNAPSTGLFDPKNALSVETQNWTAYDGLGRPVESKQIAGNGDGGTVLNSTKSIYGGDRVTTIPPVGGTATTVLADSRGQTTELRQHHTRSATAAYDTTTYRHTPRGELAEVTDPAGNAWTYTYDLLGQQTKSTDPDMGTTVSKYDDRGQLVRTDDARSDTDALWTTYDGLGRQTELREGSATGTLRARWVYDTISGAKGHLAETTRYDGGNAYTTKVVAYDRLYRPLRTSVTIPPAEKELQGTYLTNTTYNVSGTVRDAGYPKAGSLSAATVSYAYEDQTLRLIGMSGSQGLKSATNYSLTGKPYTQQLSNNGGKKVTTTSTYEWGTQRLATSRIDRQDIAGVDQYNTYRYDEAGNVLSISDTSRAGTDTQCFTYDGLRRLTEAWAQTLTSCSSADNGIAPGGPAPYWHSYTYDSVGQRQTETIHDISGDTAKDTKRTYTYPDAPNARPHALTSVASAGPTGTSKDTYTYDESGNTVTRTQGGDTQKLTWDVEGHLTRVTEPVEGSGDKVTEYLYDVNGNRLIGRTPTETTLYLGATEITLAKGSTTPEATRYFDLGGGHQAVQQNDGSVSITLADHHGTAQVAIDTTTQELVQRRTTPFGATRGTEPIDWPGSKGFVGGTDDTKTTGLTHLGAREYDTATGRFISVDPLLEIDKPQTLNGYTYAAQNPLAFTDPSGLGLACGPQFDTGCGTGVVTHADGSLSLDGNPTGGGTHAKPISNPGGGAAPVTIRPYGESFTIGGTYIPTMQELAEIFPQYSENLSYESNLNTWARSQCGGVSSQFCNEAGQLGLMGSNPEIDVLEVIGIRSYIDCFEGNGCKAAAIDATISVASAGFGKALKIFGKAFEQSLKKGDKVAIGCLVSAAHSFVAGTEVLMADGNTKPIEDVEVGDDVVVTDPATGETTVREVAGTIVTEDDKHFVDLTLLTGNGRESLISTTAHPFWSISEDEWVDAGDLAPGMTVRAADGTAVRVDVTDQFSERQRTFDLTITGIHTYYVLAGATPVLVHNSNCGIGRELIGDERADHILAGHRYPGAPGKDAFPQGWSDDQILDAVADVVTSPNSQRTWYKGSAVHAERTLKTRKGEPAVQNVIGSVGGVRMLVRYEPLTGKVLTAFPH